MRREIQAALRQRLERANLEAANNQNNSFERHHRHRTDLVKIYLLFAINSRILKKRL